ncbi:hypothetical protein [Azotobacter chroococcum]|uniref:hypothetical protein n=1 Tax=Azotobacter chroococcum TaxID=353 RepID=UPI00118520A5|nr:hypothetical protein [Azotobacter chroococcum]
MDINDKIFWSIIGLIVTTAAKPVGALWKWYTERKTTRQALLAEVQALVEIIRIRHYIDDLRQTALEIESNETEESYSFCVTVADHYRAVYDANLARLGCLSPDQASKIVRFYQMIDSVIRDVSPGGPLYESTANASKFNEAANILENAVKVANELV